jgi:diguanylate cyclase (GGDEF)-like protein
VAILLLCMAVAADASAQALAVSRLDADPVPARVLSGDHDSDFAPVSGKPTIHETESGARWWRVTALQDIGADSQPHLVMHSPHMNTAEVWRPGQIMPLRRALMGRDADMRYSARALFVPLPDGLAEGQHVYIRLHSFTSVPIPLSIESIDEVHRKDLSYVAWRAAVLCTMLVLAVLAFGFWAGIGERAYAYLMITLLCQVFYLVSIDGDLRIWPALGEAVAGDPRIGRLFGLVALIASNLFLAFFLELQERQPRLMRVLQGCNLAAGLLIVATFFSVSRIIPTTANLVLLVAVLTVFFAAVNGSLRGQRAARFLLLSWLPLLVLLLMRVSELLGFWVAPFWLVYAYPAGFALAGLVVTIGLSDKMQELRRDRDHASRLASYDALTGANSRQVIEEQLHAAVAEAHRLERPLSVVFFDIDHFKQINDVHGHRIGDQCLRIVALRTRNRLRTYDQMGRYGGDEMVVVLPDTNLKEAIGVAENLRSAINCRPVVVDDRSIDVTLSLGVAQLAEGEPADRFLERADAALYASKSAGRDRVTGHIRPMLQQAMK